MFQIQRFLRLGPTLGGGVEPGRADGAWPSPRPAQRVMFSKSRAQARPGLGDSNPSRRRPGPASEFPISLVVCPAWPVRFSEYFRRFFVLCVSSSSRFRGSNVLVSPGLAAGELLALYNRHTKQSLPCPYTGLRIPLVRRGLRSALIRHISSHDKMSRIVTLFFSGKS